MVLHEVNVMSLPQLQAFVGADLLIRSPTIAGYLSKDGLIPTGHQVLDVGFKSNINRYLKKFKSD